MPQRCELCSQPAPPSALVDFITQHEITGTQRSAEWFGARDGLITASDVPCLLRKCVMFKKFPEHVVARKMAPKYRINLNSVLTDADRRDAWWTDLPGVDETRALSEMEIGNMWFTSRHASANAATDFGTRNEPLAAEAYMRETGHRLLFPGLMRHPTVGWLAGSPDGVTYCGRLVEFKCPYSRKINYKSTAPPSFYADQVQCLLEIMGLAVADYAEYSVRDDRLHVVTCPRDPTWMDTSLPVLEQVHREVNAPLDPELVESFGFRMSLRLRSSVDPDPSFGFRMPLRLKATQRPAD